MYFFQNLPQEHFYSQTTFRTVSFPVWKWNLFLVILKLDETLWLLWETKCRVNGTTHQRLGPKKQYGFCLTLLTLGIQPPCAEEAQATQVGPGRFPANSTSWGFTWTRAPIARPGSERGFRWSHALKLPLLTLNGAELSYPCQAPPKLQICEKN